MLLEFNAAKKISNIASVKEKLNSDNLDLLDKILHGLWRRSIHPDDWGLLEKGLAPGRKYLVNGLQGIKEKGDDTGWLFVKAIESEESGIVQTMGVALLALAIYEKKIHVKDKFFEITCILSEWTASSFRDKKKLFGLAGVERAWSARKIESEDTFFLYTQKLKLQPWHFACLLDRFAAQKGCMSSACRIAVKIRDKKVHPFMLGKELFKQCGIAESWDENFPSAEIAKRIFISLAQKGHARAIFELGCLPFSDKAILRKVLLEILDLDKPSWGDLLVYNFSNRIMSTYLFCKAIHEGYYLAVNNLSVSPTKETFRMSFAFGLWE